MKKTFVFAAALAAAGASFAAQPLLTPAELKAQLGKPDVRVIDIRDAKAYAADHIPGALNAPYETWRGPASNPGQTPEMAKLTANVRALGLDAGTHAVVVSTGSDAPDFGAAARVYWTLKMMGFKDLSLLNGGEKAWADAGLPRDQAVPKVAASHYVPQVDHSVVAERDEVLNDVNKGSATLVDARPRAFYEGETRSPAAKVPGTLQGAVNVNYQSFFDSDRSGVLRTEKVRAASSVIDPKKDTVAFCNTGHLAATDWFVLSELLGQKNVKLYPGSMADWTQDPRSLPVANMPGRGKQLMIDAKLWADRTFK
jgi:thiosulfate/3-mercaptopyruvate sulfurtransferase